MYVLIPKNRKENNNVELELQDRNPLNLMNILHDDDKGGLISEIFFPRFLAKTSQVPIKRVGPNKRVG